MSAQNVCYIGNMPYTTTEEELRWLVGPRKVVRVTIPVDRDTRRPRGFGFIEFENGEDAQSAVKALDGSAFQGRTLKVNIAKPHSRGGSGDRGSR